MLDDIALFIHIARVGSLNKAAKSKNLPAATVTRRLQKLEHRLSCKLINRTAQQFSLTLEGQKLFEQCAYSIDALTGQINDFATSINCLAGKVKILAPTNLAIEPLKNVWSDFLKQYEEIELEFVLDNKTENLLASQADFALRIGPQISSELYQSRIGSIKTVLVASEHYIKQHNLPSNVTQLVDHKLVVATPLSRWSLSNSQTGESKEFTPSSARLVANELRLVKKFAVDGLGIALLPVSEVIQELENGELTHVLPEWCGQERNIYIIWSQGKMLTGRAKLLIDWLKQTVANIPSLQGKLPS